MLLFALPDGKINNRDRGQWLTPIFDKLFRYTTTVYLSDRIKESSTSTGTGNVTLGGAETGGFRTFAATVPFGGQLPYTIQNSALGEWEVGLGTLQDATTLVRTTVYASSNSNTLVNFSAGSKDVFLDMPAHLLANLSSFTLVDV